MTVRWAQGPSTGEAQVWAGVSDLTSNALNLGLTIHTHNEEVKVQDYKLRANARMMALGDELEKNTDESQYLKITNRAISEMKADMDGGLAGQGQSAWLNNEIPTMLKNANESRKLRIKDNSDVTLANLIKQTVDSGNPVALAKHLKSREKAGYMTKAQSVEVANVTRHAMEFETAKKFAFNNPDALLAATEDGTVGGATSLDIDDIERVRRIAKIRKADLANKYDKEQLAEMESLWDLSLNENTTSEDIITAIDGLKFHNAPEKDQLLRQTLSRYESIQQKRGDPLRYRKDHPAYWEMYQRAVDGDATEKDFRKLVNQGKIAIVDYQTLNNVLRDMNGESKGKSKEITNAMNDMDSLLEAYDSGDATLTKTAQIQARMTLEAKIKERKKAGRPLEGRELTEEMVRIERAMERELDKAVDAEDILSINRNVIRKGMEELDKIDLSKIPTISKRNKAYLQTATNPKTGERMGWDGAKWEPLQ